MTDPKAVTAVQLLWCGWWPHNQLSIRPSDRHHGVPEGVWLNASSYVPDSDEGGEGANVLLDTAAVAVLHSLLGDWLTSRSWPSEAKIHNEQQIEIDDLASDNT